MIAKDNKTHNLVETAGNIYPMKIRRGQFWVMLFIISVEFLLEHDRRFRFVLHSVASWFVLWFSTFAPYTVSCVIEKTEREILLSIRSGCFFSQNNMQNEW